MLRHWQESDRPPTYIDEIVSREKFEAIVVYDPVGEFLEQHYDPETDIILNPLDARWKRLLLTAWQALRHAALWPLYRCIRERKLSGPRLCADNTRSETAWRERNRDRNATEVFAPATGAHHRETTFRPR
jgi:hypothetical protein